MLRLTERMPHGVYTYSYKRGTIRHGRMWTQKHEHVGKFGSSDSHVRAKRLCPFFLHVAVVGSDDRITGNVGGVKTSSADNDLSWVRCTIGTGASCLSK